MRVVLATLMMLLTAACSSSTLESTALTPKERNLVREAVDDISRGDSVSLSKKVPPDLASKLTPVFGQMRAQLPSTPFELSLLNANWSLFGDTRTLDAVYSAQGRSGWALIEAKMQSNGGRTLLTGIYIQRTQVEPAKLNSFDLRAAGASGWSMLAAMLAAILVTIAGLVRIWRSGRFRRPWLWTIGAIIGVTVLRLNWSTGEFTFQPLYFQLFSVGAVKQPTFAPWMLAVSIPLVALIALLKKGRRVEDNERVEAVPPADNES